MTQMKMPPGKPGRFKQQLGSLMRKFSRPQVRTALRDIGATDLGQIRLGAGSQKASLWVIRNVEFWEAAANSLRAAEYLYGEGLKAWLEGFGLKVGRHEELSESDIETMANLRHYDPARHGPRLSV